MAAPRWHVRWAGAVLDDVQRKLAEREEDLAQVVSLRMLVQDSLVVTAPLEESELADMTPAERVALRDRTRDWVMARLEDRKPREFSSAQQWFREVKKDVLQERLGLT